jgi:hypothetical protein
MAHIVSRNPASIHEARCEQAWRNVITVLR